MNAFSQLFVWFATGLVLGACYFGGLWWTVRRLPTARQPWMLYASSVVMRMALLLCCLAFIMQFGVVPLFVCLGGLLVMRTALTHQLRPVTARAAMK